MIGENRQSTVALIVLGICLLIGLATAGYFVGKGAARFKSDIRTVSVKGLVEKEGELPCRKRQGFLVQ